MTSAGNSQQRENQPGELAGTVLSCNLAGKIINVVRDDLGLMAGKESSQLEELIDRDSRPKLERLFTEIDLQGQADNWELAFRKDDSLMILTTSGLADQDQIWLAVGGNPAQTEGLLRKIISDQGSKQLTVDQFPGDRSRSSVDNYSFQEITRINNELVSLQRQVQRQKAQLDLLNREKDRFLGLAAHDLRNPLGAIMSYSEFLLDELEETLTKDHREFLENIQSSSRYMLALIEDLLDVSLISLDGMIIEKRRVSLVDLVGEVVQLNEILARAKKIDLSYIQHQSDRLEAEVDPTKIRQVLNNLVSNAIKFCPSGSKVVVESDRVGDQIQLVVRDNGPGIPGEELDRLFELYQRTSVISTGGEKSTGLGLAIARNIIHMHEGTLSVESEPGTGTIFRIRFPDLEQQLRDDGPR
jgi:signal transduction histidine kinase